MGVRKNVWFRKENPIKLDDLGVTPIYGNPHILILLAVDYRGMPSNASNVVYMEKDRRVP